ncbi:hypothetical protein CKO25_11945 [Thiocapsa imhoffii]|uniref:CPXCG motif-containing cysteine-rich protein n=2 Tax=Thiocapsa imhoffii TaxID=382777 RepID=A0A9X0WIX8_9GAMM|nr:CPXCG motif-containing cysteine-rich protein [Thiocapsa imhoffii]MBK1645340.1 hypothetical protein [Thiocapsa imhoffii]
MNGLEDHDDLCPWCHAPIALAIDLSAGAQTYVEDCHVCCAPIVVQVTLDPEYGVTLIREGD